MGQTLLWKTSVKDRSRLEASAAGLVGWLAGQGRALPRDSPGPREHAGGPGGRAARAAAAAADAAAAAAAVPGRGAAPGRAIPLRAVARGPAPAGRRRRKLGCCEAGASPALL